MPLTVEDTIACMYACYLLMALLEEDGRCCSASRDKAEMVAILDGKKQHVHVLEVAKIRHLQRRHKRRSCWAYARPQNYMERCLFETYDEKMFKRRMRISWSTFSFVCSKVAPFMKKKDTIMRSALSLEKRVCLSLHRLATSTNLEVLGDLYGCVTSTARSIVIQFCQAIRDLELHDMYIKWPDQTQMADIAKAFEAMRGIPFVVGTIDGSHIPIITPRENHADYFNRKGFHSILLQMTVGPDCRVLDYDVGWAGSLHDSTLFSRSSLGRRCMSKEHGPYCLLGDCAYPARYFMLPPFKGSKEGMPRWKAHWNFVQSSSRMSVERAFGMLKTRFCILLKRCDMELRNVPNMVATCMVLHNICIQHHDSFDMDKAHDVEGVLDRGSSPGEARSMGAATLVEIQAIATNITEDIMSHGHCSREDDVWDNDVQRANDESFDEDEELDGDLTSISAKQLDSTGRQESHHASRRNNLAMTMYKEFVKKRVHDDENRVVS